MSRTALRGRTTQTPRTRRPKVVPMISWRETLAASKAGVAYKALMEHLVLAIMEATEKWGDAIKSLSETTSVEMPLNDRLKQFFALNPFGCRNSKMITLLGILLKVPEVEITPVKMIGSNAGDGSDDEKDFGFLALTDGGTAIKVIGRSAVFRKSHLSRAADDILFAGHNATMFAIRKEGDIGEVYKSSLVEKLAPMPEHYRPATAEEVVSVLMHLPFGRISNFAQKCMTSEKFEQLFQLDSPTCTEDDEIY